MWKCKACGDEEIPAGKLLDHIRLFHEDSIPESWPDGEPVFFEWD
jgi:hypothetical protein